MILPISVVIGFLLAISIGANDVSNSMSTQVGSKAITPKQAVIIAQVLEFLGAFLFGSIVTSTIMNRVVFLNMIDPNVIVIGLMCVIVSTTVWIFLSTFLSLPISTTHSIIGGMIGFGIVQQGVSQINWISIVSIVQAWVISPFLGGLITCIMYKLIKITILCTKFPKKSIRKW